MSHLRPRPGPPPAATSRRRSPGAVLLGAAVAAAALAYHPATSAAAAKSAALLVLGLGALGATLPRLLGSGGSDRFRLSTPVAAWLGLCGWYGLSTIWAGEASTGSLGSWVGAGAVGVAACSLTARDVARAAGIAATAVGGVSSFACGLQWLGGARGMELHGLQGNPNWLGLLLAVTLPLQLGLLAPLRRGRSRWRWLVAVSCSLTAGALVLAASRVAIAALAVTAAVFVAGRWRKLALVGLGLGVAGSAFTLQGSLAAWSGRWWIWRVSLHEAIDAFPLGVGVGRFAHGFLDAQGELLARLPLEQAAARFVNATTAHGDWLQVLAVGGPVALVLLGAVVGSALAGLHQRFRAGAAAMAVVAVCALGDSPLVQPGLVAVLALILAAAPRRPLRGRRRKVFMAAYAVVLASMILLLPRSVARWMGERAVTAARHADLERRLVLLRRAHRIEPRSGETSLLVGLEHLEHDRPIRAVPWLEHSRRHLANIGTDVALGNAWLRAGRPDRAVAAYRRALDRHPGYFRAHANSVEALRTLGRLDQAEQHLRAARRLQPGHPKLAGIAERLRRARIEAATSR